MQPANRDAGEWIVLIGLRVVLADPAATTGCASGSPPCMNQEHSTRPLTRNRLVVDIEADPAVLYQAPLLSILSETAVDRRPLLDDQGR